MLILALPKDERPTLEVTLPDGTTLKLLPCSKATVNRIFALKADLSIIDDIYALVADILSCNTVGKAISAADIESWDTDAVFRLYKYYIRFIVKILQNPN